MNKKMAGAIVLLFAVFSDVSACPPGTVPQQGIGWQGCAPVPGTGGGSSNSSGGVGQPQAVWADRWGAFSIDPVAGVVGFAGNLSSERKAKSGAISDCKSKGGDRCKIKLSFYNQCGALVTGDPTGSSARAVSEDAVTKLAIDSCQQGGSQNCTLYRVECSFPVRVR